jgi:hypothetical protein
MLNDSPKPLSFTKRVSDFLKQYNSKKLGTYYRPNNQLAASSPYRILRQSKKIRDMVRYCQPGEVISVDEIGGRICRTLRRCGIVVWDRDYRHVRFVI